MKQIGEYIITQPNIAKGAFASIHKGEHKYTHIPVAIKEIRVQNINNLKKYVIREIEIHKKLNNPNIVKLYDVIISNTDNAVYMFLEYCEYGDLQKFQNKKPFTEKYVQQYMLQLRNALKYLYENNIVHRDLKPQNILLANPNLIKITDFGLARTITPIYNNTNQKHISTSTNNSNGDEFDIELQEQDLFSTYCGSPIYMSPELLNKQNYNSKSDLWSVGIILYELITGTPPYIAKNIQQLITKVNCEPVNLDKIDQTSISPECFDLLKQLLNTNKHSRMDWNTFFNHTWFSINNNILLNNDNLLLEHPLEYDYIAKTTIPIFKELSITKSSIINNSNNLNNSNNSSTEKLKFSDTLKINKTANSLDTTSSNSLSHNKDKANTNNNKPISISLPKMITKPKDMYSRTSLKKQFTFNLKSSQFNDISNNDIHDIQVQPNNDDINLSDLEQDDITRPPPQTAIDNTTRTKPININKPRGYSGIHNNYNYTSARDISSSNSSSMSNNTPIQFHSPKTLQDKKNNNNSPSSITHAINFIKETYDYLSNDNKSL